MVLTKTELSVSSIPIIIMIDKQVLILSVLHMSNRWRPTCSAVRKEINVEKTLNKVVMKGIKNRGLTESSARLLNLTTKEIEDSACLSS